MSAAPPAPQVAVITVTHDSGHVLPRWIDALDALADRGRLELCVVDSGSSTAQRRLVERQARERVDAFVALDNVGFGLGCNAGVAATTAPILLFVNPDAEVRSLPPAALEGPDALDGLVIGGVAVDRRTGVRPLGFTRLPSLGEEAQELVLGRLSGAYGRTMAKPAWVSGTALMVARSDFDRIGGFSGAYFLYFEDADLCARHAAAGGRIELDRRLVIDHQGGSSTDAEKDALAPALDGINRLSGRTFAARHGHRWHRTLLYALLLVAYVPRRMLIDLLRHRRPLDQVLDHVSCLVIARRALTRLGAADARRSHH